MNRISYGLYVLTAKISGHQMNGCIINTLQQVTSSPNRVSITVNKANYTEYMIRSSGEFNVSVIDESADFGLFKHFGFATGRWENKFFGYNDFAISENGLPYIKVGTCAYISCKVVDSFDLGTHTMFIADVVSGEVLSDKAAMTYAYYHANVKPKPAAAAVSEDAGERWICNICGYIYEGALPADFVCPLCKHGAEDFSQIDKDGNVIGKEEKKEVSANNDTADEKWICSVCGYIYEGDLPDDFICPICGVGKDQFTKM